MFHRSLCSVYKFANANRVTRFAGFKTKNNDTRFNSSSTNQKSNIVRNTIATVAVVGGAVIAL